MYSCGFVYSWIYVFVFLLQPTKFKLVITLKRSYLDIKLQLTEFWSTLALKELKILKMYTYFCRYIVHWCKYSNKVYMTSLIGINLNKTKNSEELDLAIRDFFNLYKTGLFVCESHVKLLPTTMFDRSRTNANILQIIRKCL